MTSVMISICNAHFDYMCSYILEICRSLQGNFPYMDCFNENGNIYFISTSIFIKLLCLNKLFFVFTLTI